VARAYAPQGNLLTEAERSFFGVLQQAVAHEYHLFAKVRLADIISPISRPSRSAYQSALNRIVGKHVDFLLCDPATFQILAVIELDDKSHARPDRRDRDSLVNQALAEAEIPILHVPAAWAYSVSQLRQAISDARRPQLASCQSNMRCALG
jgi:hypothetical protein